jgi:hypothetical protein
VDKPAFLAYNKPHHMNEIELPKRIFFWTLVVLFWLVSGAIIGYAFGYSFSFKKGIFIYGGSITLKTTPQAVNVYLDGILMPSGTFSRLNNSYHIGGIKPGEYFLEVKAPGHQTWSKKISVHSGISTEFWNVVLTEDSYDRQDYDTAGIEKFFISPRKNLAAFSEQIDNDFIVKVSDLGTSSMDQVFSSTDYVFTDDDKENIEWSPQAHRLIIPALKDGTKNYFIVTIDTKETLDLDSLAGASAPPAGGLSHVRWDPKNKDVLFYMSDDNLYRMDLNSPQDKKLVAQHIASYDFSPKGLFYMQLPEGIVYRTSLDAADEPRQITTSAPDDMDDSSYRITVYDEDRIVLLNRSHDLYIYNKGEEDTYFNKLSDNADGSQFSDDGKKLLFWTDNEISTYFVRKWEVQPARSENETMSITRLSDRIENVQWARDYEHVLFTNGSKIKIIEIDNRDHRNMMDILTLGGSDSSVFNNFTDGKIYFTEKNDQGQASLHSIYFPERTTFLQGIFPSFTSSAPSADTAQ